MNIETKPTAKEYWIPKSCLDEFTKRLEKLNRKAAKLDLEPLVSTVTDETERRAVGEGPVTLETAPDPSIIYATFVKVLVYGNVPQFQGYAFLARIEHIRDGQNICHTYPGAAAIPDRFYSASPACDHCHTNRYRKDTYIVHNTDTGEYRQVGSDCIKDFLGHELSGSFWSVYGALSDPDELLGGGYSAASEYPLTGVLAYTGAVIRADGWVSSGKAYETDNTATKDTVSAYFWGNLPEEYRLRPTTEDLEAGKAAIEWAANIDTAGENYLQNIQAIAKTGVVTDRGFGLACSILPAHHRAMRQAQESKPVESTSEYIGEIGKRQEFTVTVQGIFTFDGTYGTTAIHKMTDEKGNMLTWFASGNPDNDLEKGKTYNIKATVKKHDAYKGVKQTVVNRVKVLEQEKGE